MEEKTIQNIPAVPFALMMGAILAVIGLIMGIIFALVFGSIISMVPTTAGIDFTGFGVLFGLGAIIIMPIGGFIGGLIEGLIIAVIYNILAPRIGGIRLRFKEEYRPPPP
jgi:cell shape-determining protein MreD